MLHPGEIAADSVEALFTEQGRARPVMFWLAALLLGSALAALPVVRVDLSVRGRGIVRADAAESNGGGVVIEAFVRESDAWFIRTGERAVVQFDAYPAADWGSTDGVVEEVSAAPVRVDTRAVFKVTVDSAQRAMRLPDGRTGPLLEGMTASVRIVVNRKSLLQLIYERSSELLGL